MEKVHGTSRLRVLVVLFNFTSSLLKYLPPFFSLMLMEHKLPDLVASALKEFL